jgi:hypothetical protein
LYTYTFCSKMKFTFVQNYYSFSIFRNNKFHVGDIMLLYTVRSVALHSQLLHKAIFTLLHVSATYRIHHQEATML